MSAWGFSFKKRIQLRRIRKHSNKLRVMSHKLKAECISDIKENYLTFQKDFNKIKEKLIVKANKIKKSETEKDEFGNIIPGNEFTQTEIGKLKSSSLTYKTLYILFLSAETGLFYLSSEVILGDIHFIFKLVVSLVLGFMSIFCFNQFFEKHFDYLNFKSNKEKYNLTDAQVKQKFQLAWGGYIMGVLGLAITVLAAILRILYIEHIDTTGMTQEELDFANRINTIVTYLMIAFTLGIGIGFALYKYSNRENILLYKTYKKWRETIKKANKLIQIFVKIKKNIDENYKILIEKEWQLVKELERIWGIDIDEQNMELYKKLKDERNRGTFVVSDTTYTKYVDIINTDRGLFEFGVMKESGIENILSVINKDYAEVMGMFAK